MGFPRILSKNNKIYTKLGEFCLSIDGNQFFIVCHTCQQELQTQDTFWKHIQDEHSFMHELKCDSADQNRVHSGQGYIVDGAVAAGVIDVPPPTAALVQNYRESNIKAEHGEKEEKDDATEEEDGDEPKDYTEMRVIEPSAGEVNIKVEQPHMVNKEAINPQQHQEQGNGPQTLYIPNATGASAATAAAVMSPHIMTYSSIFQHMPQVCAAVPPVVAVPNTGVMSTEPPPPPPPPKDSSSATSEDGERYYICAYSTCGLKFKYQSRLAMHLSVHSKVRRFVCDLCDASFKQSCNLSTHRKKKHNVRTARMLMNE